MEQRTVRQAVERRPIRALRVKVVAGPDKGKSWTGDNDTISIGTADDNDLVLTDDTVSRYHVELRRESDRITVRDHGSTNGTFVGQAAIREGSVATGALLVMGKSTIEVLDGQAKEIDAFAEQEFHGMIGRSRPMRELMARLERVAKTDASVLLLGETGVGKEVVATAIHRASLRASRSLEIVDCGALMPTLVASELFGHEKGAFTGANQRHLGAFERANGGTIFLDEIGELDAELQVRLLGVLERRQFRRVGGSQPISVDVRVVCATHRDLRARVNSGEFRHDLYYRIAVAKVEIPPLRERPEDIPQLIEHFLVDLGIDQPVERLIPSTTLDALARHHWPGNVRELRNFVEALIAFGASPEEFVHRDASVDLTSTSESSLALGPVLDRPYREARDLVLREFQKIYLKRLLDACDGNVSKVAARAEMNRTHLVELLKRLAVR